MTDDLLMAQAANTLIRRVTESAGGLLKMRKPFGNEPIEALILVAVGREAAVLERAYKDLCATGIFDDIERGRITGEIGELPGEGRQR